MAANEYQFVTKWRVLRTVEQVMAKMDETMGLTRWWPEVYLSIRQSRQPLLKSCRKDGYHNRLRCYFRHSVEPAVGAGLGDAAKPG